MIYIYKYKFIKYYMYVYNTSIISYLFLAVVESLFLIALIISLHSVVSSCVWIDSWLSIRLNRVNARVYHRYRESGLSN